MPRNQDVLDEFEKHLAGEQKDIRDFLLRFRLASQLAITVLIPVGFTAVGRLVKWDTPSDPLAPTIGFFVLVAVQGFLVWANLKWTPKIDSFSELSRLRQMLQQVNREARAHRNSSQAYGFALAALRAPLTPAKRKDFPPILDPIDSADKFKHLAVEIMAVFEQDKVSRFLGTGTIPERFCASLYGMRGIEDGEMQYELIDRRSTEDYKQVRGSHSSEARVWAFNEAILKPVSIRSKPYAADDLQSIPGVPTQKQRPYDGDLYRGALFARSNWHLSEGSLEWDNKSEKPPAYLLIFTAGTVGAFKDQENNISGELLIEAVRDLLDTLLLTSYSQQTPQPTDSKPPTSPGA